MQETVADLKKLVLKEGEWEELAAQQRRLAHGSSLLAGAQSSLDTLSEAEGACLPQLNSEVPHRMPYATAFDSDAAT